MNIKSSNGCYFTQKQDVPLKERKFLTNLLVSTLADMEPWVEITEAEKKEMEEREIFFSIPTLDKNYLYKVSSLLRQVSDKINDAQLAPADALEMQKFYPKWEDIIGKQVFAGFCFECDGILFEVVEPHKVSEDKNPCHQPMLLNLVDDATAAETPSHPTYYKPVTVDTPAAEPTEETSVPNPKN